MSMPGDNLLPFIISTRSITINAPASEVWDWLIQLGADRGGFYSYWFIEQPLGYNFRAQKRIEPEFKDMKVGRIVRASLDQSESAVEYNFPVISVERGKYFVLKNWGCFLLNEIDAGHTRLIVRTHRERLSGLVDYLDNIFMMPLHYIMERRMLIGIKARAEAGPGMPFSSTPDMIWFLAVCLSLISIIVLLILSQRLITILLAVLYSTLWLLTLFILEPVPVYSVLLFALLLATLLWLLVIQIKNRL
jgi:hypothetical protein